MDDVAVSSSTTQTNLPTLQVIRRNGAAVVFNADKISIAVTKAFLAVEGNQTVTSSSLRERVATLTQLVVNALVRRLPAGGSVHIENIQDQVELALMRSGEHDVARAYVLYRENSTFDSDCNVKKQGLFLHCLFFAHDGFQQGPELRASLGMTQAQAHCRL